MGKNSVLYLNKKQEIFSTYVQPLLDALDKTIIAEHKKKVIAAIGKHMHFCFGNQKKCRKAWPGEYKESWPEEYKKRVIEQLLYMQFSYEKLSKTFKFSDNEVLYNNFKALALYYIGENDSDEMIARRTTIREIFFDIIDPCPEFKFDELNTSVINFNKVNSKKEIAIEELEAEENTLSLIKLPVEMQLKISSFFQTDPDTIRNYRAVCKDTYKLQKSIQDKPHNTYFTLGKKIKILDERGHYRDNLKTNELLNAAKLSSDTTLKLFASFYDAIEYAQSLLQGRESDLGYCISADGYIHAILAVSYVGDSSHIQSMDEIITLNKDRYPSFPMPGYLEAHREVAVSYFSAEAKAVLPVAAICLYPDQHAKWFGDKEDFLAFKVFDQILNLNELLCKTDKSAESHNIISNELDDNNSKKKCSIM